MTQLQFGDLEMQVQPNKVLIFGAMLWPQPSGSDLVQTRLAFQEPSRTPNWT